MIDLDELERIVAGQRSDHLVDDKRGISPKARAAQECSRHRGVSKSHRSFARWTQRNSAPITLPTIKAFGDE